MPRAIELMRKWKIHAAIAAIGVGFSATAWATLAPVSGDSYINSASPNGKNGTAANLQVSSTESALFNFNINTLPTGVIGMDVEKATLILWVNKVTGSGTVTLYPVTSLWDEATVTFNSAPGVGASIGTSSTLGSASNGQYLVFDVTAQARSWVDAGSSNGFMLKGTGAGFNVLLDSKENAGVPALLDVTLWAEGPPGPAGPRGAVGSPGPTGSMGPAGATGAAGPAGPQGPAGATGSTGAAGAAGPQGAPGVTGTDGKTIRSGTIDPTSADGIDGDFYLNTASSQLFGPKASGAWPAIGVPLVGPQGAPGPAGVEGTPGAQGPQGPAGPIGGQGPAGPAGSPGPQGPQGPSGLTGAQGSQGPAGTQGPTGAQGVAGPPGPPGPPSNYSVVVDINNNLVPFGWNELMGSYTLTNSEGIVARAASFTNTSIIKPGEQVIRQVLFISGGGQLYFTTAGCAGDVGYVAGGGLIYSAGNGIATLDAPGMVNTPVTFSFWRYDMTTPPKSTNLSFASLRSPNGTCQNNPTAPSSVLTMNRGASLTFLNALWPVEVASGAAFVNACVPANPCTGPPSTSCAAGVRTTYPNPGTCSPVASGTFSCSYPPTSVFVGTCP